MNKRGKKISFKYVIFGQILSTKIIIIHSYFQFLDSNLIKIMVECLAIGCFMRKSRDAFTMIELIFVILILAILVGVALPKLSAIRADAEASSKAHSVMTAAAEIVSYSVVHGNTDSNMSKMSDIISSLERSSEAVLANNKAIISTGSISDCVTIEVLIGTTDNNLTITFGNANGDSACNSLQLLINADEYPVKLRGPSVVY